MKKYIKAHKVASFIVIVIIVCGGYYWYSQAKGSDAPTKYVVQAATEGTLVSSVSASGQVSASEEIDIKPQVSETVTGVYVKPGDQVKAGQLLVQMDSTNEERAVRDAELSLQSAQLQLQELQQITTSTLLSNQSAVIKAQQSAVSASSSLAADYQGGFNTLSTIFNNLQTVMTDAGNFVTGDNINKTQDNPDALVSLMPTTLQDETLHYASAVLPSYNSALAAYEANLNDYHAAGADSSRATLDALFNESYQTTQLISTSLKSINDLLNFVVNNYPKDSHSASLPSVTNTYQTTFGSDLENVNGNTASMLSVINSITNDKNSIQTSELSLEQTSATLEEYTAGPTQVQLLSQNISIENAQNSLATAQENLADTSVRAPIAGTISAVPAEVGATVPSPAVSMVSGGKVAIVTLNEVDAAKVKVGQKATLTFDALPDLSLAGEVVEVDPVGTVSQGVVNYNVQIGFSEVQGSNDVKPGMSVDANIAIAVDQNVVTVPNSAVSTEGGASYVMEPASPVASSTLGSQGGIELAEPPIRVPVEVGLSNDTVTEVTSGVESGDQIIVQTILGSPSASASGASGASRAAGLGGGAIFGGGGGGARVFTGRGG